MSDWKIRTGGGMIYSHPLLEGNFFKTQKDRSAGFLTDYESTTVQLSGGGDYWSVGLQEVRGHGTTRYLIIGQEYYGVILESRLTIFYWVSSLPARKRIQLKPHFEWNYGESWKMDANEEGKVDRNSVKKTSGFQWGAGLSLAIDALLLDNSETKFGIEFQSGMTYRNDLNADTATDGFASGFRTVIEW